MKEKITNKDIETLIDKIKDMSYLSYDDNPRHILDEADVIQLIQDYFGKENE